MRDCMGGNLALLGVKTHYRLHEDESCSPPGVQHRLESPEMVSLVGKIPDASLTQTEQV
jgi:hypothetical protein